MKLIVEVNKGDLDFVRKTYTQDSRDYIPMVIRNRFADAVLNGIPLEDNEYRQKMFSYLDGVADGLNESNRDKIDTLEQIRDEIERLHYHPKLDFIKNDEVVEMALDVIDKHTKGDNNVDSI